MTISNTIVHLHSIEKLEGILNYMTWKNTIEIILIYKDLQKVISDESKALGPQYIIVTEPAISSTATTMPIPAVLAEP